MGTHNPRERSWSSNRNLRHRPSNRRIKACLHRHLSARTVRVACLREALINPMRITRQHRNFARVANLTPRAWWRLHRRLWRRLPLTPRKAIQVIRSRRARGYIITETELDSDGVVVTCTRQILPVHEIWVGENITYQNGVPYWTVCYMECLHDSGLLAIRRTRRKLKV